MPESCEICLHRVDCFAGALDEESTARFTDAVHRLRSQRAATTIIGLGNFADCCYILCEGLVKICRVLADGDEIILDVLAAPAELGKGEFLQKSLQSYSVVAISEFVEMRYIPREILLNLLKERPAAMQRFFVHLRDRTEKMYQLLTCMKLRVRDRLLALIGLHFLRSCANLPVKMKRR